MKLARKLAFPAAALAALLASTLAIPTPAGATQGFTGTPLKVIRADDWERT